MGRKTDPNSQYRVYVHVNNGYRYASTQPSSIDEKTGKRSYHRVHWGTVDDENKFIPGKKYILSTLEERRNLIFPENWDLSEIEKLSGRRKKGRPAIEGQDENRLYGDIWLLEQIADATGVREDLKKVFDGNTEKVDFTLTLAMYLLCGKDTYNQMASWQRIVKTPSKVEMTSSFITRFTQSITEQHRMDFIRLRGARLSDQALCAVDSTSRSAWGESLADIRYGKNKDDLPLPQTLEVVVYTLSDHMPVYYRTFPGNIPDSRSLETIKRDLDAAGIKNVVMITDRGYESIHNLEYMIDKGQPMIMGTKVNQAHVTKKINDFGSFDHHPEGMDLDPDERFYYKQYDMEYQIEGKRDNVKSAKKLKLNLYFDPMRRGAELINMDIEMREQKSALETILKEKRPLDDDVTIKRAYNYYKLEYSEATRILDGYELDEKKVARKKRASGFFANTTLGLDFDAMESHHHYKLRSEQEKYFAMMKGVMGADRQRNWSENGKTGRLFILFVAQILGSCLSYTRKTKLSKKFDSVPDVLGEMRPIRYVEHKGTLPFITPFVGKQIDICEAFGFAIPEGCAPEYVVRKTNKGKRGRPRKGKLIVSDE